jgi:drug/metabolite transporter (DMT)-like permease
MVFIPPPHVLKKASEKPQTQHDTTVGMLVVAVLMLGIAVVLLIVGPRSHDPPPPAVPYAVLGLGALFGLVSFFSWMKEQNDDGDSSSRES